MTQRREDERDDELPEREREHVRHRDRKRTTRMVVDNAGVRRVLPAIARRGAPPLPDGDRAGS